MAFFTKGKTPDPPPVSPADPPTASAGPVSWDTLVAEVGATPPATPPPASPASADPPAGTLDPQSRAIIEKAGRELSNMLFKGEKDDGDGQK